nr:pentapeptide repeat-containing protein [Leptolyngbyaceae cyanobacterium MO_188.B28]
MDGLNPRRQPTRWIDNLTLTDFVSQALKGEIQRPVCANSGEPIRLTRSWEVSEPTPEPQTESAICPYKGLSYFECNQEDPKYFYGRTALTDQLLDQVRQSQFLAIVGASGSGKSSVLRAGLLHQLKLGRRLAGSETWDIHILLPGEHPLQSLAQAFVDENAPKLDRAEQIGKAERLIEAGADGLRRLVQASDAPRVVLVVDQFEEAFTLCRDRAERQAFFAVLMGALEVAEDQLCLIIAMRADFVGKCFEQEFSGLADHVQKHLIAVKPMNREELTQAIVAPAERVNLTVEPELVKELLDDVERSPGNLPLLQYTLTELWRLRENGHLQLHTYAHLGGVTGTLKQQANKVYDSLTQDQQLTAKHIFLNLTQLGEGTEDTRRRVLQQNLVSDQHSEETVSQVVKKLVDSRLIVTNELVGKGESTDRVAVIDVAHEALIRNWPLLRRWLDENRDLLRQQRKIEVAAEEWRAQKKYPDYLLQGRQLLDTKRFQKEHGQALPLSQIGQTYMQRSLEYQRNNRIKRWGFGLAVPLVLTMYAGQQITTYYRLRSHWDLVYSYDPENKVSGDSLVKALTEINTANRSLARINLREADLRNANLSDANFREADLSDANLRNADLYSADLRYADLRNADLYSADLRNADLYSADLSDADLRYADLRNADLYSA